MAGQDLQAKPSRFVTFIGGTAYSGSTLLDMILANDQSGFSCGEVGAYVYPFRRHHKSPTCGCGEPDCGIWRDPRAATVDVHRYLFDRFPDVSFLVDSSKSIEWISQQHRQPQRAHLEDAAGVLSVALQALRTARLAEIVVELSPILHGGIQFVHSDQILRPRVVAREPRGALQPPGNCLLAG